MKTRQDELFEAIEQNKGVEAITPLIHEGADVNGLDRNQMLVPLVRAIHMNNYELAEFFIKLGADVNNNKGMSTTPLMTAIWSGNNEFFDLLIKHKADINLNDNNNPLVASIQSGKDQTVKTLIELKAEVNPAGAMVTPLTAAAPKGDLKLVQDLIGMGAEVNPVNNGEAPLTAAARSGNIDIVRFLLTAGAKVNPAHNGQTPLIAAVIGGNAEIVKLLLEQGAEVNRDSNNQTPLIMSIQREQEEISMLLLDYKANVNLSTEMGGTPLKSAVMNGRYSVAKKLIDLGANIKDGIIDASLLENLIWNPNAKLLELLLQNGADANARSPWSGKTLSELAIQNGKHDIADIFKKYGAKVVEEVKQDIPQLILLPAVQPIGAGAVPEPEWMLSGKETKQKSKYYRKPFEITIENYQQLVERAGIGSPKGTKVNFENDGFTYICTFTNEITPINPIDDGSTSRINKRENNYDNTITRFTYWDGTKGGKSIILEATDYYHDKVSSKFFDYCIKHGQQRYKFGELVLGSQVLIYDENNQRNTPDIKEKSKTFFQNGIIYTSNTGSLSGTSEIAETKDGLDYIYVVDKKGKLFVNVVNMQGQGVYNHHTFLKGKPSDPCFTYGKEVACAGHVKIKGGKIIEINNMSGHYHPIKDQMKLVAYYFYKQNILANDVIVKAREEAEEFDNYTLSDVVNFKIKEILAQYKEMPNLDEEQDMANSLDILQEVSPEVVLVGQDVQHNLGEID